MSVLDREDGKRSSLMLKNGSSGIGVEAYPHFSLRRMRKNASPSTSIWQRDFQVGTIQHDHVNHIVDITKSVGLSDEQFYLVVGCFDSSGYDPFAA